MRVSGTIKTKVVAGSLAVLVASFGTMPATASALDLGSLEINLPTGSLTKPVTDLLNPVTEALPVPITTNSTPSEIGANLSLPTLGNSPSNEPDVSANVNVLPDILPSITEPVSQITNPVIEPVTQVLAPVTQPLADTLRPITQPSNNPPTGNFRRLAPTTPPTVSTATPPAGELTVQQDTSSNKIILASTAQPSATSETSSESNSIFTNIAGFFSSSLSGTFGGLTSGFAGKDINTLPIVISALLLILTVIAVGVIVYSSRYGGTLIVGRYNLTKFAQTHDISQLVAFGVAAVSFGIIAILLSITVL